MSQTIDSRVVQMQFDNHQFESGAAQSMGTLKNLDKALKGVDGAQAFANISRAAGNVDLSSISSGVQALQERFSVMGTYVHNTLLGIVDSAVNAGKQIANALVFNPAKTGFAEYELQLNSTQRILANTKSKGEDIKSVNAALDELNEYADLTIYNFSQMTDNIGRFTAAGVGLKDSTTAIKGLSNAAALFGADSMAASRAGYQLSQALAAGSIKLMDWNSLVNASMGGEQMQNAIMRVARHHGVAIDAMIEKEGSFRETLSSGWLTTDIMLEALSHFTMANDEASRSALEAAGYTQEEIDAIIELGETATESATVVKTASQLFDTLGEELGSVWAQTWRSIMGDYEEAKTTFSAMHEELSGIVGAWGDAQTALVEGWAELGGRTDLFDSVFNVFEALKNVIGPIGQAFADVFPPITAERLADLTRKLKDFTQGLILNESQMAKLKSVATTVFSGIKAGLTTVTNVAKAFGTVTSKLIGGFAKSLVSTIKYIGQVNVAYKPISEWLNLGAKSVINFANAIPGFVDNVIEMAESGTLFYEVYNRMPKTIQHVMAVFQNSFKNIQGRIWGIKQGILQTKTLTEAYGKIMMSMPAPIQKVMGTLQNGYYSIKETFQFIRSEAIKNQSVLVGINSWIATLGPAWQTILTPIADYFGRVQIKLMEFREALLSASTPMEIFESTLVLLPKSVQQAIARFKDFAKVVGVTLSDSFKTSKAAFSDFFNVVIPNLGGFFESLKENIGLLKDDFSAFFVDIGSAFTRFLTSAPTSVEAFKQSFLTLKNDISAAFDSLKEKIKSFFKLMSDEDPESAIPGLGNKSFKLVVNAAKKLYSDLQGVFEKGWGNIKPHLEILFGDLPTIISDKAKQAVTKIEEIFSASSMGEKIKSGFKAALSGLGDVFVDAFGKLTGVAKESSKKAGKQVVTGLKDGINKLPDVIGTVKDKAVEKTKLMGAHLGHAMRPMLDNFRTNVLTLKDDTENLMVKTFDKAADDLTNVVPKIQSAVVSGIASLPETVTKIGNGIRKGFSSLNDFLAKIPFKETFSQIGDGLEGMYESITGLKFESLTDSIKKGFDWLINGGAKQIITALLALDIHALMKKWKKDGKALADMFEKVGGAFKKLGSLFSGVSAIPKNFNKTLRSMANKNNAEALKDVAKAIGIFAASIWVLSSIPWENMKVGLTGFGVAVGVAVAGMAAFTKIASSMGSSVKTWSLTKKGLTFNSADNSMLMGMGAAMVSFAAAVGILALAMSKLANLSGGGAVQGITALVTIVTMVVGSMKMLSGIDAKGMGKLIIPLMSLGLIAKMLSGVVEDLAGLEPGPAAVAVAGLAVMFGSLTLVLNQMSKVNKFSFKAVVGLAAVALVIAGLRPVIAGLSTLDPMGVISVCGGLALLMVGIGQVLSALNAPKFKANVSILSGNTLIGPLASFALLIGVIGGVIFALSKIENPNAAIMSATAIAALLLEVGALLHHINTLENIKPAAAATIAALGVFITMFGTAIVKMALVAHMNPIATAMAFTAAVSALALAAGVINRVPDLKNYGAAVTMVAIGAFITQFAGAVSLMATLTALNPIGAIISTIACCTALSILLRQINNLPDLKGNGTALSLVALGLALNGLAKALVMLSGLSVGGMLTGLVGVGGILIELSIAINKFDDNAAGIAGLRQAGMAFLILSVGLNALSRANPVALIANLAALGIALFAFSKGATALQAAIPAMTGAAVAMIAFGAAALLISGSVALFGVGLQAVAVGLVALSTAVVANLGMITAAFTGLLYAFIALQPVIAQAVLALIQTICTVIVEGSSTIADALGQLLLAVLEKGLELVPQILQQLMEAFIQNMDLITQYAPQMADAFTNMFVTAVDAIKPKVPVIVTKLTELLHVILDELVKMLQDLATLNIDQIGAALVGVIGVGAIMGKFSGIFKAALKGIGELAILIAEIGAVLLAFGELAKIPGLSEAVVGGGELLSQIGYAIGNFVGSIIGGFGAGATSGLSEIAENLSAFAIGVQPFIITMKSGGGDLLGAVEDVAAAMMVLVGADFLSGIAAFLGGGGTSLASFGEQLVGFATPFRQFCDKLQGIDVAAVTGGARAAKALAEMMETLSTAGGGGLEGLIFGDGISLSDFGEQIIDLGDCLRTASTAFTGVDSAAILAAIPAAQALADLAKDMPRKGGWIDTIAGERVDLSTFGEQVNDFGTALATASTAFTGVDSAAIESAIPAAQALTDLAKDMPRKGGWVDTVAGEQVDLPTFGAQVGLFGSALAAASKIMDGVDAQAILDAIEPAEALARLAESMVKTGGFVQKITGEQMDLATFGADVSSFGGSMKTFSESITGIDESVGSKTDIIVGAMESLGSLKEKVPDLPNLKTGINIIANMKDNLVSFGESIVGFSDSLTGIDATVIQNAQTATECIKAIATSIPSQEEVDAIPDLSGLQTKFEGMAKSIKTFGESLEDIDPSQISSAAQAFDEIITLVNRINSINVSSFSGLAEAFKNAATNAVEGFKTNISNANISSVVDSFFASAKNSALANTGALTSAFTKPITDANQSAKNLSPQFSATGKALIKALGQGVSEGKSSVITAFTTAVTAAKTSVSNMSSTFSRIGADLVQGLINGINSKKQAAIQAGAELGNAVSNATRNATQVRSPSKVFFKIGDYLVQGLANGIIQNTVKAIRASRDLANGTITAMQEELRIESPSKVARDEVGNWIVEGIADGIEENMSAEEAAAKKAENIINAFQTAIDAMDLQFTTKNLDKQIADLLDYTGSGVRDRNIQAYRDAADKAYQEMEYRKGAYETLLKQGFAEDDQKVIEALNSYKEAQVAWLKAKDEYYSYMTSNEDKYTTQDKITENLNKELEIWKAMNEGASQSEIAAKEQELMQRKVDIAKEKAADLYAGWQIAIKTYGEYSQQAIDAYSAYLDSQEALRDLLVKDTQQTEENTKTFKDYLQEWASFWNESSAMLEAEGWTYEQVAESWSKTHGYNPITGAIANSSAGMQSFASALSDVEIMGANRITESSTQMINAGQSFVQNLSTVDAAMTNSLETVGQTFSVGMANVGTNGVTKLCETMVSQTPSVVNAGNEILSVIPEKVVPANQPEWVQAGLALIQSMIDGVRRGESPLTAAISEVVQKALANAMKSFGGLMSSGIESVAASAGKYRDVVQSSGGGGGSFGGSSSTGGYNLSRADAATLKWLANNPDYKSAVEFYWTFESAVNMGAIKGWVRNEAGEIVKAGQTIGSALNAGVSSGISSSVESIVESVHDVATIIPETISADLEINSPSRVMERFGMYVDAGLANGIVDNKHLVSDASVTILDAISKGMETEVETPAITPVIDFDALKSEVTMANKMLGRISLSKLETVSGTIQNGKYGKGKGDLSGAEVINNYDFTQNNYSPKALSNATIYRQSKNMFAMAVRKKG